MKKNSVRNRNHAPRLSDRYRKENEMEAFLNFSLPADAVINKPHDRVVRIKKSGDWKNWFLEEDVSFFKPLFSGFMREFSYDDDWALPRKKIILPKHASGYVKRILVQANKKSLKQNES